jgi:TolB-like protein/DNA-binding SARP family transcriptional activator
VKSSAEAQPASPYRLETLGTLVLRGPEGRTPLADHGQQGWRLALLAVLAASGEQGCSRDRLLLLFWPDASQQRARHSLEQLLYKMRKSMGESLFAGVNPLRLNPAVITTDMEDFEQAIRAGDFEAAVGNYHGPFLDGFYLRDSPEFEEWVTGERARLESAYTDALERLAQRAEEAAEHETAVRWWRELYAVDPLSSRSALGLMRALANSGDHTTALRHSEQHERVVQQELGTSVGPEISALAAEIRARSRAELPLERRPERTEPTTERPQRRSPYQTPPVPPPVPPPIPPQAPRRHFRSFLLATAGIGSLALVIFAATQLRQSPAEIPAAAALEPSIAVLPLTNLSGDPADAGLADGMTEELTAILGRTGSLRVVASTSVLALHERRMDVRQIADSLRVTHVLEGALQRIGSRLRMQIRLVDARDGATRWSETYDREIGDVFALQDDIARAVARELDVRLAGSGGAVSKLHRYTPSLAAYEWYLRGMDVALMRSDSGRRRGMEYFQRAIEADSNFAAAYAGLSRMHLGVAGDAPGDYRDSDAQAENAALKAVALDDSLAEAHSALGWVRLAVRDWESAEAELQRAIALDPRVPRGHEGLARIYLWTGRPAEQLAAARLGLEADPFSHSAVRELTLALNMNGRCDESLALLRPLKDLSPPASIAGMIGGACYASKQMWPEAVAEFRWAHEIGARSALGFLGYALARGGETDEARRILSDLQSGREISHGAFGIAVVYAGLRDYDQAFAWLDKAADENSARVYLMDPMFEDLHRDPRFDRLKARLSQPAR